MEAASFGSARPMAWAVETHRRIGREAFEREFPGPGLLLHANGDGPQSMRIGELPAPITSDAMLLVILVPRKPKVTIGRVNSNDIVLPHASISSLHAVMHFSEHDKMWSIADAGSRNGTFYGGQRLGVEGEVPGTVLHSGATLVLGSLAATFMASALFNLLVSQGASRMGGT